VEVRHGLTTPNRQLPKSPSQCGTRGYRAFGLYRKPRPQSNFAPGARMLADPDDPAVTGGGSDGYNQLLRQEP